MVMRTINGTLHKCTVLLLPFFLLLLLLLPFFLLLPFPIFLLLLLLLPPFLLGLLLLPFFLLLLTLSSFFLQPRPPPPHHLHHLYHFSHYLFHHLHHHHHPEGCGRECGGACGYWEHSALHWVVQNLYVNINNPSDNHKSKFCGRDGWESKWKSGYWKIGPYAMVAKVCSVQK